MRHDGGRPRGEPAAFAIHVRWANGQPLTAKSTLWRFDGVQSKVPAFFGYSRAYFEPSNDMIMKHGEFAFALELLLDGLERRRVSGS